VDHLIDLDLPFVERERFEPIVLEKGLDLFVAAIDAKSRDAGWSRIPDDFRRPDAFADDSVESASVEGFVRTPGPLDVLLRHRPRSMSRRQHPNRPQREGQGSTFRRRVGLAWRASGS